MPRIRRRKKRRAKKSKEAQKREQTTKREEKREDSNICGHKLCGHLRLSDSHFPKKGKHNLLDFHFVSKKVLCGAFHDLLPFAPILVTEGQGHCQILTGSSQTANLGTLIKTYSMFEATLTSGQCIDGQASPAFSSS